MSGGRDEENFDFLGGIGDASAPSNAPAQVPAANPAAGRVRARRGRRSDAGTGRRSQGDDYTQVSARVDRIVKADFDVALARERAETGRKTDQSMVIENLMRFFAERGDPFEAVREVRREQRGER